MQAFCGGHAPSRALARKVRIADNTLRTTPNSGEGANVARNIVG